MYIIKGYGLLLYEAHIVDLRSTTRALNDHIDNIDLTVTDIMMHYEQKVLSSIYTNIDYDQIELRPNFALSSHSRSHSSSLPMSSVVEEDIVTSSQLPSYVSHFDDDERNFVLPTITFTLPPAHNSHTESSMQPYWESMKTKNVFNSHQHDEKKWELDYNYTYSHDNDDEQDYEDTESLSYY